MVPHKDFDTTFQQATEVFLAALLDGQTVGAERDRIASAIRDALEKHVAPLAATHYTLIRPIPPIPAPAPAAALVGWDAGRPGARRLAEAAVARGLGFDGTALPPSMLDTLTSVEIAEDAPAWSVGVVAGLYASLFDELPRHLTERAQTYLRQLPDAIEQDLYHSGGGFMHALCTLHRDGTHYLLWSSPDVVGLSRVSGPMSAVDALYQTALHEDGLVGTVILLE